MRSITTYILIALLASAPALPAFALSSQSGSAVQGSYASVADPDDQSPAGFHIQQNVTSSPYTIGNSTVSTNPTSNQFGPTPSDVNGPSVRELILQGRR